MNLTVDIGNTAMKAALFDGERIVERFSSLSSLMDARFDRAIVCSTRGKAATNTAVKVLESGWRRPADSRRGRVLRLTHDTATPIRNLYATPRTLGLDRLAAAVGAHTLKPDTTVLVVDFGTAITFDLVTAAGEFVGGNISAGAGLRFKALSEHTSLPLCGLSEQVDFPAHDTKSAIESGVTRGIVAETEHYIAAAMEKFGAVETIFTGGDAQYFAEQLKIPIFVASDLVFQGLNEILKHNADK